MSRLNLVLTCIPSASKSKQLFIKQTISEQKKNNFQFITADISSSQRKSLIESLHRAIFFVCQKFNFPEKYFCDQEFHTLTRVAWSMLLDRECCGWLVISSSLSMNRYKPQFYSYQDLHQLSSSPLICDETANSECFAKILSATRKSLLTDNQLI